MDQMDRKILIEIQGGIPLTKTPYKKIADSLNISEEEVLSRIKRMLDRGWIRRIGCIPHHYNLGFKANGMSVWDVPDDQVKKVGAEVGSFDYVSHCYRRPRHPPIWPYNLFAMVHGRMQEEVLEKVEQIAKIINVTNYDVLFSTAILKKRGIRLK